MKIEKRTLNWFPKQSAWQEYQQKRAKRREIAERMSADRDLVSTSIAVARDNQIYGRAELAAKAAAARVSAEAKNKLAKLA